jgi:hypothetical protein
MNDLADWRSSDTIKKPVGPRVGDHWRTAALPARLAVPFLAGHRPGAAAREMNLSNTHQLWSMRPCQNWKSNLPTTNE